MALERGARPPEQSARLLFARLRPALARWRRERVLRGFFFLRKPPDLRLRLAWAGGEAPAEAEALLRALRREGVIVRHYPSAYEPETYAFGGPEAMAAAHDFFGADSLGWAARSELEAGGACRLSPAAWSLAVLDGLFARVVDDLTERWDVWCNVARLHGAPPRCELGAIEPALVARLIGAASRPEAAVLRSYGRASERFARRLDALLRRGKLLYGRRSILPFVALHHWNRYGVPLPERARLYQGMMGGLDPRRGMAGVEAEAP